MIRQARRSYIEEGDSVMPNKAHSADPAMTSQFHNWHQCRGASDARRQPTSMNAQPTVLDRLDRMPAWGFTSTLYLVRWFIVIPIAFMVERLFPAKVAGVQGVGVNIVGGLVLAPVLETLLECAAPYWIMRRLGCIPTVGRAWGFVAVAGVLMMLLHAGAWPTAILPSLVTGSFLGYIYGHFAPVGFAQAFLHTSVFHACINIVGCILTAIA